MTKTKFIFPLAVALLCSCTPAESSSSTSQPATTTEETVSRPPVSESSVTTSEEGSKVSKGSEDISEEEIKVASLKIAETQKKNLYPGEEVEVSVEILPENATDKSFTLSSSDEEVAEIDGTKVKALKTGKATITATSASDATKKATFDVNVSEAYNPANVIHELVAPSFLGVYNAHKEHLDKVENILSAKSINQEAFYENEEGGLDLYRIGDDNPFDFKVVGAFYDEESMERITLDSPSLSYSIKVKEEGKDYSKIDPLSESERDALIEYKDGKINLSEEAVGKTLQLTVEADKDKYFSDESTPVVFEFEAVDGYNVYDAKELCLFDNSYDGDTDRWADFRVANKLDGLKPAALVLQSNINVTKDDIPASFLFTKEEIDNYIQKSPSDFQGWMSIKNTARQALDLPQWSEEEAKEILYGSMKDFSTIYDRNTAEGESIAIEGNYYSIDASSLPQIYSFADALESRSKMAEYQSEDGSHGQLFGWNSQGKFRAPGGGTALVRNLSVKGNGDYSADDKYMGGLMTFKVENTDISFQNIITSKTFLTFMSCDDNWAEDHAKTKMSIDRCKNFDSYNSLLYIHGTNQNTITNSLMRNAGGAIALLDEVNAHKPSIMQSNREPTVDCQNVNLENYVSGLEPWFVSKGVGALVTQISNVGLKRGWLGQAAAGMSTYAYAEGKRTVAKEINGVPYINLICADMCGASPLGNTVAEGSPLQGHFRIDNGENHSGSIDMKAFNAMDPNNVYLAYEQIRATLGASSAMIFGNDLGGHGMTGNEEGTLGYTYRPDLNPEQGVVPVIYNDMMHTAPKLNVGDYMACYIKVGETHYLGAFLGMNDVDVE